MFQMENHAYLFREMIAPLKQNKLFNLSRVRENKKRYISAAKPNAFFISQISLTVYM